MLKCGHIWTCPVCSGKLRSERWGKAQRGVVALLGTWQMLTLTIRHHAGLDLGWLIRGLMKALADMKRGGRVQRLWAEHVTASLRALEVTHGAHGWHPHLHLFLRTDGWTLEETAELFERWQSVVEKHLGAVCVPDREHGLRWSTPVDFDVVSEDDRLAYLFKLGQELTGSTKEAGRSRRWGDFEESRTHWQIAESAADGDARSEQLWADFRRATKGRRMIECDDRLARASKARELAILGQEYKSPPDEPPARTVTVPLTSRDLCVLRVYERNHDAAIVARIMTDVAASESPSETVRVWLDVVYSRVRVTRFRPPPEPHADAFLDTG